MNQAKLFHVIAYLAAALSMGVGQPVAAQKVAQCGDLPSHATLQTTLDGVVDVGVAATNGGLANDMWVTVVNRDGVVCAVAFSGDDRGDQWPGSRVISAQKANTANAFSLPGGAGGVNLPDGGLALSTANLFSAVQPGQSLFGLQLSNPVDSGVAYGGNAKHYGQHNDAMVGGKIGGVNVFGGGLGLYDTDGSLIGALGVSGDTSCTDHIVAWKVRDALGLDNVLTGVSATGDSVRAGSGTPSAMRLQRPLRRLCRCPTPQARILRTPAARPTHANGLERWTARDIPTGFR
jgi:uncharacterized protein GlcG (DUF336 family)